MFVIRFRMRDAALVIAQLLTAVQLMMWNRSLSDIIVPGDKLFCDTVEGLAASSPIRLWSEGDFNFVGTSEYNHSYLFQANVTPPITVTDWPLSSSVSPCFDSPELRLAADDSLTIRAVYYVNTKMNVNYDTWIRGQFLEFAPVDELYIVADARSCAEERGLHDAFDWLRSYRNESVIELECHDGPVETFEYHGIHKLWELGQKYPGRNDIGIYFHSKGVTHANNWSKHKSNSRSRLTGDVFGESPMRRIREVFRLFPIVDMAGQDCSQLFWVWHNFMYARGSYLNTVEQPVVTDRRHYYEDWLSRSGRERQEAAPYAPERPLHLYPPHRAYSCYALTADHKESTNFGFYSHPPRRRRHPIGPRHSDGLSR